MATKIKRRHPRGNSSPKKDDRNKLEKLKDSKKKNKTARLYRRKNSRVNRELKFQTPNNTKLT